MPLLSGQKLLVPQGPLPFPSSLQMDFINKIKSELKKLNRLRAASFTSQSAQDCFSRRFPSLFVGEARGKECQEGASAGREGGPRYCPGRPGRSPSPEQTRRLLPPCFMTIPIPALLPPLPQKPSPHPHHSLPRRDFNSAPGQR